MTATVVGLDMSLTSPGIACFSAGVWNLWCFALRKKDENLQWQSTDGTVKLKVLPMIPGPSLPDVDRYRHIITHIQRECVPHWPSDSRLYLENYVFVKPGLAGSSYKIHELGGILKYELAKTHPFLTTVAPSVWKKQLTGISGLSKHQTLLYVQSQLPQLDLMNLFGFGSTLIVPNPVQDIADAIGIVMAAIDGQKPTCYSTASQIPNLASKISRKPKQGQERQVRPMQKAPKKAKHNPIHKSDLCLS